MAGGKGLVSLCSHFYQLVRQHTILYGRILPLHISKVLNVIFSLIPYEFQLGKDYALAIVLELGLVHCDSEAI